MENKNIINNGEKSSYRSTQGEHTPLILPPPPKASAPVKPFYPAQDKVQEKPRMTTEPIKKPVPVENRVSKPLAPKKEAHDNENLLNIDPLVLTKQKENSKEKKQKSNLPATKKVKVTSTEKNAVKISESPKKAKKEATVNPILIEDMPIADDTQKTTDKVNKNKAEVKPQHEKKTLHTGSKEKKNRTIGFSQSDYLDYAGYSRRKPKSKRLSKGKIIGRIAIVIASVLIFAIVAVYGLCFTIAKGPSETVRNLLVLSAKQASATKWVPGLFLDSETIDQIMSNSEKVETDIMSIEDYYASSANGVSDDKTDEWENAQDGMIYKTLKGSTYTAYMLIVKDPSRIFVGTSSNDYNSSQKGKNIFDATKSSGAVAAINGGEFPDNGGIGTGSHPIGLTYSMGKCVWNDGLKRTFIGFDNNNKLIASETMTKNEADKLGIRDAVSFQTGNVLISSDEENVTFYYAESNNGTAQRTAIGQRADGAVILLVTDGRTASSLGATHNDIIDIMVEHGAVTAAMLDGGSSAMMYYENYYEKYDYDYEALDEYQKKGLVNKYKAFTSPRYMPTFFMVAPLENGGTAHAE